MDYELWRDDIFGKPDGSDPVCMDLLGETYAVSLDEALDHIDHALVDSELHELYSRDQIGIGLQYIYSNSCSDLPFCYVNAGDNQRRVDGIRNMIHLYMNFFERHCSPSVGNIGNSIDGAIEYVCYMLWDVIVLNPGSSSPEMIDAGLDVMQHALGSTNESCIVSAIHGLGHWVDGAPRSVEVLEGWLRRPTTQSDDILRYARQATTGCIM
mgnify:CR=1 FL=1